MRKKVEDKLEKETNPYELDKLSKVPSWLIVLVLKFWAATAAIYFIGMSVDLIDFSEMQTEDPVAIMAQSLSLIILFGLFLAIFENYMVRPYVRLMYNRRNNTFKYNMINVKGFKSFFFSLLYMMPLSFVLFFVTIFLGKMGWVFDPFGTTGGVGIEPFTYGLSFLVCDSVCLIIKNLAISIFDRVKYYNQIKED